MQRLFIALVTAGLLITTGPMALAKPNDTVITGFCVTGPADANGPLAGNPAVLQGYMPKDPYGYGVPYGTEQGATKPQYSDEFNYYHIHVEYHPELIGLFAGASPGDPVCVVLEGWEQHEPSHAQRGNGIHLQVHTLLSIGRGPGAIDHAMRANSGGPDPYLSPENESKCGANRGQCDKERL
jgi:hypothetical protein